jgi:threonine/homoserine/homoserine lactone efflux protein
MQDALLIASVTWLAILSPGADFAMVSRNSFLYGRSAGLAASTGIAIACWFHVMYAIFGIAIVQRLLPQALDVIRMLGAAYLIYVGVTTAVSKVRDVEHSLVGGRTVGREMMTGILTNGLNPKTSIFVISLYTQVIGRDSPLSHQLLWGLFICLSHLAWFAVVSVFLSKPAVRSIVLRRQRAFNVSIGAVLAFLGVLLLTMGSLRGGA